MDKSYTELEIGLHLVQAESYQMELRFINPKCDAEMSQHRAPYRLLGNEKTLTFFQHIKIAVEAELCLQVRLLFATMTQKLHALCWELRVDPDTKAPPASP